MSGRDCAQSWVLDTDVIGVAIGVGVTVNMAEEIDLDVGEILDVRKGVGDCVRTLFEITS